MDNLTDGRLRGKDKSIGNRQRFIRRHKEQIREAVRRAVNADGIKDVGKEGKDISIPKRDMSEPVFSHSRQGGKREAVHPGNKDYIQGDKIKRPQGGGGGGGKGNEASDSGEGEDDFTFHLTKEEYMEIFFEDLGLPNLKKSAIPDIPDYKSHRAGFNNSGNPSNLSFERTMRKSIARRIALHAAPSPDRIEEVQKEHDRLCALFNDLSDNDKMSARGVKYLEEILIRTKLLEREGKHVPFLDPIDLKFRNRVRVPVPAAKAVMFCLMDVSGSMDEERKERAKRFFILLHLFLEKQHENIDLVFIRHHTVAEEVNEHDFFHSTETGGTIVSSALILMDEIIKARYSGPEYTIYGAQASDGDNTTKDSPRCVALLKDKILPRIAHFFYFQVIEPEQDLWDEYKKMAADAKNFAMGKGPSNDKIYPAFREFFKKRDDSKISAMALTP
jgi:uncharacterized sporulation protein YeaH/YhbH (DUF444 family)